MPIDNYHDLPLPTLRHYREKDFLTYLNEVEQVYYETMFEVMHPD
jgi:hypothetical protein